MAEKSEKIPVTERPMAEGETPFADFHEAMRGRAWQGGGRHDLEPRGFASGSEQPDEAGQEDETPPGSEEAMYVQDEEETEEATWRKRYGDSENEKGQYRRTANELAELVQAQKAELDAMRAQFQTQQPQYGYSPQPQYPQAPPYYAGQYPAQQQMPQLPDTYFPDKEDPDDIMYVRDVDRMLKELVAPAMIQLHQAQAQMQMAQLQAQKAEAGLTPALEQQLAAKYPWIGMMPEGPARVQAMKDVLGASGVQQNRPQPRQAQVTHPQAAARRVTYVETSKPNATSSQKSVQQEFAEKWAKAKTAFEKRKLLEEYGMGAGHDFRGADVLGR